MFIASQVLLFIAFLLWASAYLLKKRSSILVALTFASALYCAAWIFLSAYTAAVLSGIAIIRFWIYANKKNWKLEKCWWLVLVFCAACVVVSAFSWQGAITVCALATHVTFSITGWSNNPTIIRIGGIIGCSVFVVMNILLGSYVGAVTEAIMVLAAFAAIIYYSKKGNTGKIKDEPSNLPS
jgi:hypothetical protein